MDTLEPPRPVRVVAKSLIARGIAVVPVPAGKKGAVLDDWPSLRITEDQVDQFFRADSNIGVLCGEPSGHRVDVDLDCPEAVAFAEQFLPPTAMKSGRDSRPNSHLWYRCPEMKSLQRRDPETNEMIVEVRCTGLSTVVGPSIHPDGDRYHEPLGEATDISASELTAAANAIADAVLTQRYGYVPLAKKDRIPKVVRSGPLIAGDFTEQQKIDRARKYLARMPEAIEKAGGSNAAFAAACAMVHGFELDVPTALSLMLTDYNSRCQPPWSHKELLHKCEDAATKPHDRERGWLLRAPRSVTSAIKLKGKDMDASPGIKRVLDGPDEHRVIDEAVEGLSLDPNLFERNNSLVRTLRRTCKTHGVNRYGSLSIDVVSQDYLSDQLSRFVAFERLTESGLKRGTARKRIIGGILARREWSGIRNLAGVSDVPLLRPDGTVFSTPGYDDLTGVYYDTDQEIAFLTHPSREEAIAAAERLQQLFSDFEFHRPGHVTGLLCGLLTIIARTAFEGPAPLFLIIANMSGTGKSLLCQIISAIVFGRPLPVTGYPERDEELGKIVTTILLNGDRAALFDNIDVRFGSSGLNRLITSSVWMARQLGTQRDITVENKTVWFGTGNNVQLMGDMHRRIIPIRLETMHEKPEERTGFAIPNIVDYVTANRAEYLRDAFTILQAYICAGKPPQLLTKMGGFDDWQNLVPSSLMWAGLPDCSLERRELRVTSNPDDDLIAALVLGWKEAMGVGKATSCRQLIDDAYAPDQANSPRFASLRPAIEAIADFERGGKPSARELGNQMRAWRGRWCNGFCFQIDASATLRTGAAWFLTARDQEVGQ